MSHAPAYLCVSHLPWDSFWERPQHLLSRFARAGRAFFVEPPVADDRQISLDLTRSEGGVHLVTPHLPGDLPSDTRDTLLASLLSDLAVRQNLQGYVLWCTDASAIPVIRDLTPLLTVYDCAAETAVPDLEGQLLERADLIFTSGPTLHETLRYRHPHVYLFPDAVDPDHFRPARSLPRESDDAVLAGMVVRDEAVMDWDLVERLAGAGLRIEIVGPVPADLQTVVRPLGTRSYSELPATIAPWDVALLPFRRTRATRALCPADPLLFAAAGKPVIASSLPDMVIRYRHEGLVQFAHTPGQYLEGIAASLAQDPIRRFRDADRVLAGFSWDHTWKAMHAMIGQMIEERGSGPDATRGTELALRGA